MKMLNAENGRGKLQVKCFSEDDNDPKHPSCPHGPCLLFFENDVTNGFFACSAFRDRKDCNFQISTKHLNEKHFHRRYEVPTQAYRLTRQKLLNSYNDAIYYCHNCNTLLLSKELKSHKGNHDFLKIPKDMNTNELKIDPTGFLKPLQNDKAQAQYFFDTKALSFFSNCFDELGITKVVCIGAPSLHYHLLKQNDIKSYLLDIDHRFYYFFDDTQFAWYNMFNNHFFDEQQKMEFMRFLKSNNSQDRLLLFTDPPFGCRTEAVANTLRQLTRQYNTINKLPHQPVATFWIFPYFSASYIQNEMSEMEMCDYKVNYMNHIAYSDNGLKGNRKLGSPVRIFTNIPLQIIKLPVEEYYKYCAPCRRYTALENRHCKICETCPSKNGSTYRHCMLCGFCVKPNYVHCNDCRRCTQIENHNCKEYQSKQHCWICTKLGHIERDCEAWLKASKKFVLTASKNEDAQRCFFCGRIGHNERICKVRHKYIEESMFLGKTVTNFK